MIKDEDIAFIYNKYVEDLYSYGVHLGFDKQTVMDAVHDVFCKLCANEEAFHSIANVKFYLFRSLKNRLLDIYKQQRETVDLSVIDSLDPDFRFFAKNAADAHLMLEERERKIRQRIDSMLQTLSPRQREIVYLRYVQGYDYEQISEMMHINLSSCRKLLHKAMQTLRETQALAVALFLLV